MAVIRAARHLALYRCGALLPALFDGFVITTVVALILDDPGQRAYWEPRIACFEAGQVFHTFVRALLAPAWPDKLRVRGKEAEGALRSATPGQLAYRCRVRVGLYSPLDGRPVGTEAEGTNHLLAPLDLLDKVE